MFKIMSKISTGALFVAVCIIFLLCSQAIYINLVKQISSSPGQLVVACLIDILIIGFCNFFTFKMINEIEFFADASTLKACICAISPVAAMILMTCFFKLFII